MVAKNLQGVKIGFIGAGNMAKAIGGGLIKNGVVEKSQIFVNAPSHRNFEWWKEIGVSWVEDYRDIIIDCDIIFLAMKPQTFKDSLGDLEDIYKALAKKYPSVKYSPTEDGRDHFARPRLWVSILAGTTLNTLSNKLVDFFPMRAPAVIRVMPNTPMTIGQGCSVFCGSGNVSQDDFDRISTILGSLGKTFKVKEELIDSVASVTGSGPAFMYIIIEAMSDAGVKMGIPRDLAIELAAQAMVGSAQMVLQTGRHPGVLKDEVCSPGGSTIAGLHVLEQRGVRAAMMDTLEVTAAKNKELGKVASSR